MVIADTGFWLAIISPTDRFHGAAVAASEALKGERLVTTWPVMTETTHLMLHRLGPSSRLSFVKAAGAGAFDVFALHPNRLATVHELMQRYVDLPMDLADASLVVLAEALGSGRILSTDLRDFRTYRWKNHKPFKNLLDTGD